MSDWYYQLTDEVIGPVSLDELKEKADAGEIAGTTLVREGTEGPWVAASDVETLPASPAEPTDIPASEGEAESLVNMDLGSDPAADQADPQEQSPRRAPLSLRPCKDCGKMVSRQAVACPECGRLFHEASSAVRYRGEHPVPVLVVFILLAIVFVLLSPIVVHGLAEKYASEFVETPEAAGGFALMVAIGYVFSMVVCAVLGGAVGKPRMAYVTGLFLGLFFGPLGVFAAFAIDKRPQCCHCSSRLDGLARECPFCHAKLIWKTEPTWY